MSRLVPQVRIIFQYQRDDNLLLIRKVSVQKLIKVYMGLKQMVDIISGLIFILTIHQDYVCFLTKFIDVKMQFLMVAV